LCVLRLDNFLDRHERVRCEREFSVASIARVTTR
jgi:hypothetical protein